MGKVLSTFQSVCSCVQKANEQYHFTDLAKMIDLGSILKSKAVKEETDDFTVAFNKVKDSDGEVDAYQLKGILNDSFKHEFDFDGFSTDVCRSMVASKDDDLSGQLGIGECKSLWTELMMWRAAFQKLDSDNAGHISVDMLHTALQLVGMEVSAKTVKALTIRYGDKQGKIHFSDYLACMVKLKYTIGVFKAKGQGSGKTAKARFQLDEFIQMTTYS